MLRRNGPPTMLWPVSDYTGYTLLDGGTHAGGGAINSTGKSTLAEYQLSGLYQTLLAGWGPFVE